MARKRVINPANCKNVVREQVTFCGILVSLSGKYSQEWSVSKEVNGKITINIFPNRKEARKEFNKYK